MCVVLNHTSIERMKRCARKQIEIFVLYSILLIDNVIITYYYSTIKYKIMTRCRGGEIEECARPEILSKIETYEYYGTLS